MYRGGSSDGLFASSNELLGRSGRCTENAECDPARDAGPAHRAYTRTVEAGEPQRGERAIFDDRRWRQYEFLILPLATDGLMIDKLLTAVVYLDRIGHPVNEA
jgi:hypothetical protein